MTRPGLFGWDYPPGCSGPPDPEGPCDVCGAGLDDCCCPVCPICRTIGRPSCYVLGPAGHGLTLTAEQQASPDLEREQEEDRDAAVYAADLDRDRLAAEHYRESDPRPWYEIIP